MEKRIASFHINLDGPHIHQYGPHLHLARLVGARYVHHEQHAIDPTTIREGDYCSISGNTVTERDVLIAASRATLAQLSQLISTAADSGNTVTTSCDGGWHFCIQTIRSHASDAEPSGAAVIAISGGVLTIRGAPISLHDFAHNIAFAAATDGHLHIDGELGSLSSGSCALVIEPRIDT